MKKRRSGGFTLVELSIVLVVIGLIVGGILTGQELIRQAKLRSVVTQMTKYKTAVNAFRGKFNYLPGDLPNASTYMTVPPATYTGYSGNGDGSITFFSNEEYYAWEHLGLTNMIEGGSYPYCFCSEPVPGTNVPASTLGNNTGWMIFNGTNISGGPAYSNLKLMVFKSNPLDVGGRPTGGALSGVDAKVIDSKIDDGKPATGRVIGETGNYAIGTCYDIGMLAYTTTATPDCMLSFFAE